MPRLKPVSYKQLAKVFEAAGFICVRIEGDHMVMTKLVSFGHSKYRRANFIIKNNLRTAGIAGRYL